MKQEDKQTWINSFAPDVEQESRWDAIFLAPQPFGMEELWTWYAKTFVDPEGEMHHEWLAFTNRFPH